MVASVNAMPLRPSLLPSATAIAALFLVGCGNSNRTEKPVAGGQVSTASETPKPPEPAASPALVEQRSPAAARPATGSGKTLVDPTGVDLFFLQYSLSGLEAPFGEIASLDQRVRSGNAVSPDAARTRVEAELRARADAVRGTEFLEVNLNETFGMYDSKSKELDFDMVDGTFIPFHHVFGREVDLVLTNGSQAQAWKLEPAEAEDVFRRNGGDRRVLLALKLQVLDAPPAVGSGPTKIDTRVLEYEVKSAWKRTDLGKVVVAR
jgi:hypothetical protein